MPNVFLSVSIPKTGPWTEPLGLRYIASGNPMGSSGHKPPQDDLASALGWLYACVTGQVAPAVGGGVATLGGSNIFTGSITVEGSFSADSSELTGTTNVETIFVSGEIETSGEAETRAVSSRPVAITGTWPLSFSFGVRSWAASSTLVLAMIELVDLPHGQTLESVTVSIAGSATDVALPAMKPKIEVIAQPVLTGLGGTTSLGVATDAPANLSAYQAQHAITLSGLSHEIDREANNYYIVITSEGGANANAGMQYLGANTTFLRNTIGRD